MNDLERKLAELKILETKFAIWVDRLGQNDEIVQKLQAELNQANAAILDLMIADQEKRIKSGFIV